VSRPFNAIDAGPRSRSRPGCGRNRRKRRRGTVLVAVLVCVAVVGAVILSSVKLAATQRQAIEREAWQVQAVWLAEAGLERAAARLAVDNDYQGETWKIPPEPFGHDLSAVVTIEVLPVEDRPDRRTVRVSADYPDDPIHRCRRTKQAVVALPEEEGENP